MHAAVSHFGQLRTSDGQVWKMPNQEVMDLMLENFEET